MSALLKSLIFSISSISIPKKFKVLILSQTKKAGFRQPFVS
jgi:hypothetical protein